MIEIHSFIVYFSLAYSTLFFPLYVCQIKRADSILPFLITAYECPSSVSSCGDLVQFVDQILPPLSEWDEVKLYVALPLLAAVLKSSNQVWKSLDSVGLGALRSMITYLAQFSISSDHDAHSRSAAASCLFSILFHSTQDDDCDGEVHLFHQLLEEVYLELTDAVTCLKKVNDTLTKRASSSLLHSSLSQVGDTFSFLGLLVSRILSRLFECVFTGQYIHPSIFHIS